MEFTTLTGHRGRGTRRGGRGTRRGGRGCRCGGGRAAGHRGDRRGGLARTEDHGSVGGFGFQLVMGVPPLSLYMFISWGQPFNLKWMTGATPMNQETPKYGRMNHESERKFQGALMLPVGPCAPTSPLPAGK